MIGLTLQLFCSLFYFSVVIVTAVYRFNDKGRLTALSLAGSAISTDDNGTPIISTERTYQDDGQMILRLWIVSMVFLIAQCCLGGFSIAPPTQDQLRKMNYEFEEERNEEGQLIVRAVL
jgi:hypothetical protein